MMRIGSEAKRLHEHREHPGRLATARIIEVVADRRRRPIAQHLSEAALCNVALNHIERQEGQAQPRPCRVQTQVDRVEGDRACQNFAFSRRPTVRGLATVSTFPAW